jgi:hypothetical protein
LAVAAGLGLWALAGTSAHAQTPPAAGTQEQQREYDAAFQEMLKKPADLDVLFKFAAVAAQTGDLEGAISALERMLLINNDLPRVRLELGVLYYRLKSYEVARTYLEGALKSPNVPPDVRGRAEEFLTQIQSQQKRSRFTGEVFQGFRYQSNANLGPATSSVRLFGQAANLNQQAVGAPDWGSVTTLTVRHFYDFGTQDKATLETQFIGYINRQFTQSQANVSLIDLTTGPRFQVFDGIFEDVTVKPLGAFGAIWVNDTPYYVSYGAGVEVNTLVSDRLRNISTAVWRKHDHNDTSYLPTNSQFKGTEYTFNTVFPFQLTPIVSVFGSGSAQRYQTDMAPWQSYSLLGFGGGMSFRFVDPVLKTNLPWTVSLTGSMQWWHYDAPDATVDPTEYRNQQDLILNVSLSIPFDERTTFSVSGGRFVRQASIPNYAFENNNVMFGVSWRF